MSTLDGYRVTTLDAYLPADHRPANLALRPGSQVATVTIRGGRATGVRLADQTAIEAGFVVLSAGTYGSPTLLLRSGVGPADELRDLGIAVVADLPGVGRHLADHPGVELEVGWRGEPTASGPVLHSIATLRSSRQPPGDPPDLMFWMTDPSGTDPHFYLDPILLKPQSRGVVRLRSADPAVPPRIALPGLREPRDIYRLAEGYRLGIELANDPAMRRLAHEPAPSMPSAAELTGRVLAQAYALPHVVGTCRMGPSPADGDVVDAAGRVHGIGSLAVVDASIMPDAPAGFPHIVTIMIAEHMASGLAAASAG
jgi:choline dehydrogenase